MSQDHFSLTVHIIFSVVVLLFDGACAVMYLSGTIPREIGDLVALTVLDLHGNLLTGEYGRKLKINMCVMQHDFCSRRRGGGIRGVSIARYLTQSLVQPAERNPLQAETKCFQRPAH